MSIRSKLTLSYLFLFLLVVGVGAAAFWAAARWRHAASELTRAYSQGVAAERLRADIFRQIAAAGDFISGDRQAREEFFELQKRVETQMVKLRGSTGTPEEADHLGALEETQKELVYFAGNIFDPAGRARQNPNVVPAEKLKEIGDEVTSDVAVLNQYYQGLEQEALAASARSGNLIVYLAGGAAVLALAQLLTTVFFLQRWLAGPIAEVGRVTSKISRGDFEAKVSVCSKDEWGELAGSVNRMAEELKSYEHKLRAQERLAAMGELASFAAHNIRNPLAGIRAAAQVMLAECGEEPVTRESLEDIIESVDKLDIWIQRLLGFAKPLSVQPVKSELAGLIDEALRLTDAQLKAKKIAVESKIGQIPPVAADPALLEQVLSALMVNAVEAREKGGSLSIQATANDHEATLSVSDTGKGIPVGILERVFKPFVTDKPAGTGLGLAQAKKIVDLHGGEIKVESRVGEGTKVILTLPLWREEQ